MSLSVKWVFVPVVLMAASLPVSAQTDPPPPGKTTAAPKATAPAPEPAAEPAVPAAPPEPSTSAPSAAEGVMKDIEDQQSVDEIDKQRASIRQMVLDARMSAQRFHIARAKLADIIKAGKCGGIGYVMENLDRQEADARKLLSSLDASCDGAGAGTAVAAACQEERGKLDGEIASYAEDRAVVQRMCKQPQ